MEKTAGSVTGVMLLLTPSVLDHSIVKIVILKETDWYLRILDISELAVPILQKLLNCLHKRCSCKWWLLCAVLRFSSLHSWPFSEQISQHGCLFIDGYVTTQSTHCSMLLFDLPLFALSELATFIRGLFKPSIASIKPDCPQKPKWLQVY